MPTAPIQPFLHALGAVPAWEPAPQLLPGVWGMLGICHQQICPSWATGDGQWDRPGGLALLPELGAKTTWASPEGSGPLLGQLCLALPGVCSASARIWISVRGKKYVLRKLKQPQGSDQVQA